MYLEEQKILLCGIDHGFSTMKTTHFVFENGVKELGGEATLTANTMLLNGKYYKVGEGRLPLKDTKVEDEDYFLLTLAAIAKEMEYYGLSDTEVYIAAGLPFTRFGQEKAEFKEYLNLGSMDFSYSGKEYHITCRDVFLYPQCYAAVADRLGKLPAELLIVDIGSKTVDIIHTRKHVPVESDCITILSALIQCMANINNVVYQKTNRTLTEEQIQQVMMYGNALYSDKMVQIVREELGVFARGIEAVLKEHGFDPELTPVVYVGGGAVVMKRFGSVFGRHIMHIEDMEIQRFLEDETAMFCYGDKSKFIKKALIREIRGVKRDEENKHLVCEMNTQRTEAEKTVVSEADRIIDAVKLIVQDEMKRFAGMQVLQEKQVVTDLTESMPKASKEAAPTFGVVPESLGEDVSEDVLDFLESL